MPCNNVIILNVDGCIWCSLIRCNSSIHLYEAFIFELIVAMPNIIFLLYTYSLGTLTICSPLACRNTSLGALTICSSLAGRNTWSLRRRRQARDLRVPSQWELARRIQGPLFRCCHCNRRATMYVLYCRSIQFVMLCLHERLFGLFVARHRDWRRRPTPKPLSRRLSAEVEHVPILAKK